MERKVRIHWTNWTFGFWWGSKKILPGHRGIDIGPLEISWRPAKRGPR